MGRIKIAYYRVKAGRGYWEPSKEMRAAGLEPVKCGPDGPSAWKLADAQNARWKSIQSEQNKPALEWPPGTIGDAYIRYKGTAEWSKKALRTRKDDWEWSWKFIGPIFGDVRPIDVTLEDISAFREVVRKKHGQHTAHRCIKIWRAIWKIAAAMGYAAKDADPSFAIINSAPPPRSGVFSEGEIVRIVKAAWRKKYHGLAVAIAIAWDTGFSPVDVRTLTLAERIGDNFHRDRAKTGRAAIGTLSKRTVRLLDDYLQDRAFLPSVPFLRNRSGGIYTSDRLGKDFRNIRKVVFGDAERRAILDMRRSGTIEAFSGGADAKDVSAKLANDINVNNALFRAYNPVSLQAVQNTDAARRKGRRR